MNAKVVQFKPLMPRTLRNEMLGLSFEDFMHVLASNSLLRQIDTVIPRSQNLIEFDNKIQYLIETKKELINNKKEIQDLWELCYKIIAEEKEQNIESLNNNYIFPLISITGEANFTKQEKEKIVSDLENIISKRLEIYFIYKEEFLFIIQNIINWYHFHYEHLHYLELTFNSSEISFLKRITEDNSSDLETLKSTSPLSYLSFIEIIKSMYKSLAFDYKQKFRSFYLKMSLQQIIVAKNSGFFYDFDKILEDYYSEKLKNKKLLNWLYKYLTGYGEKPWRLATLFFFLNFLFSVMFTFLPFKFHYTIEPVNMVEKFFTFLSFNNTTMLTVGYGDVYPEGIGARIFVALLQLLGFAISSSAIALFLRRILRF